MPPKQPGPSEKLTVGDRLVSALVGGACASATAALVWFLVLSAGGRTGHDVALPFWWAYAVAGGAAAAGFVLGPERLLDVLGRVWRLLGSVLFGRGS